VRGAVNSEYGTRNSPWTSGLEFHSAWTSAPSVHRDRRAGRTARGAGRPAQEYGNAIIVDHGQDIRSLYGTSRG